MIPVRVYVENFMSYRQGQELLFDSAPLWVLAGENGTGKSTIFDVMTFALYGLHRGGKQNHKDLINHQEDSLAVEFDFLIDNSQYRIRRTVSRRSAATRQISEIINNKIKPISNTDSKEGFKEWIEEYIGLNDNAFTSCVLLTQGNSDKLLTAKGTERFTILKQIVDLFAYEKLHEQAKEEYNKHKTRFEDKQKEFKLTDPIKEEQLIIAQEKLKQAKNNYQIIQNQIDNLNQLIPQAKQREQWVEQIEEEENKKQKLQQLIDRSTEITTNFNYLEELRLVIPKIQDIITTKERLVNTQQKIYSIEQNLQSIQNDLDKTETEQNEFQIKYDCLQQNIEELQSQLQQITNKLSNIAPLITKLEQYEKTKAELEQCDRNLTQYPSDLSQQVKNKEKHYRELVEINNTLPWLRDISESRSSLSNAIAQQNAANVNLSSLESQLAENRQQEEIISINAKELEQAERDLSNKLNIEQNNFKILKEQLQSFEEAATKPTCELCGQEITPEHARQEKQRLNLKLVNLDANVKNLEREYSKAKISLSEANNELETIERKTKDIERDINQNQNKQKQAQQDIQKLLKHLDKDWNNLLQSDKPALKDTPSDNGMASQRIKISLTKPNNELKWIETTYPNNLDIEQLEQQVNSIKSQKQNLYNLQKQLEEQKKLNDRHQIYSNQLKEYEISFSIAEAQQAKEECNTLKKTQQQIDNSIKNTKHELQQIKDSKIKIDGDVDRYRKQLQEQDKKRTENKTIYQEIETTSEAKFAQLPHKWQEEAGNVDQTKLQDLQQQANRLAQYQELKKQLDNAQQALDYSTKQIASYQQSIAQLPTEAHRLSTEIKTELKEAKKTRENYECIKSKAEKQLNQLEATKERYAKLEQDTKQAEKNSSLYKTLSNLLGKDGIQTHILRHAEITIVAIANEILDSLSRGSIRLELRKENERKKNEALDLIAYNLATGEKPTAVALTSGSQRFRIAVSLALAIGQYVGNNARNIESVIIDEGFGGLDKNGRDDMIEELNELKQRLKRIILVSHQEEFFNEFNNGYKIKLIDGASEVSLLASNF